MRRGIGYSSGVQAVLKVTPENGYQSLCSSGAVALVLLEMPAWHCLGNLEPPQRCLSSALRGSELTPSKEEGHGRCAPPKPCILHRPSQRESPKGSQAPERLPVPGGDLRIRAWQRMMFRLQIYSCLLQGRKITSSLVQSRSHPAQTWGSFKGSVV